MKRICTKCIVAALILSMGITAGIPAYAAQPQTTAATEQAAQLSLEETASQYFENYPSDKHVVSAEQLLNRVEEGESFCLLDIRSAEDYAKGHIQDALETTSISLVYLSSFTPTTKVGVSLSFAGAEITTFLAPALM